MVTMNRVDFEPDLIEELHDITGPYRPPTEAQRQANRDRANKLMESFDALAKLHEARRIEQLTLDL